MIDLTKAENQALNYTVQAQEAERMFIMSKAGKDLELVIKDMVRQVLEFPPPSLTQALFDHSGLGQRLRVMEESIATEEHIMREIAQQEIRGVKLMAKNAENDIASIKEELSIMRCKLAQMERDLPMAVTRDTVRDVVSDALEEWLSGGKKPENAGAYWTIEEDEELCETLRRVCSPIAASHGRTFGAIISRIRNLIESGVNPFSPKYMEGLRSNMQYYNDRS